MKILGICGSPRGGRSQTRVLLEALLDEAKAKGAQVDAVDLGKVHIGFCQACEACHKGPDCVMNDDGRAILRQMLEADGIVLASPVYLDHVTAQMKAILDRTSHFVHCLRFTGKYIAALTTSGGGGGDATMAFMKRYAVTVGAQFVGGVDARVPLKDVDLALSGALGASLVTAIAAKQQWPDQAQAIESQRIRFRNLIAFHKDLWPYEYKYWQDMGWM